MASLAAVRALNQQAAGALPDDEGASDMRFGFRLEESAKRRGVDFVHEAPDLRLQARAHHAAGRVDWARPWRWPTSIATGGRTSTSPTAGRGVSIACIATRAMARSKTSRRRLAWPTSTVARPACRWARSGATTTTTAGRIFSSTAYGQPELFRNDGGRRFVPRRHAGLPRWVNANAATWLDYDRDGRLDLFLAGYWPDGVDLWKLETTRIMPESFEYANNGGRKFLLRNRGDGAFEDTTAALGITSQRWTLAVTAADLFGTGYPDLFLANDYGVSELFANRSGKRFEDVAAETGVGRAPKSGMNASLGDVFNDGRLAIYKTNISEPGVLVQGNDLWVPKSAAPGGLSSRTWPRAMGVDLGGWSWGAQFGDLNNDGTQDIYLVNGYISAGERSSYWYDFSVIAVGHSSIIADAANWPAMKGRSLSGYQRKRVWINDGLGQLHRCRPGRRRHRYQRWPRRGAGGPAATRGALDVIVANQRGPLLIYENHVAPGRHWIQFELEGTASNRSAIGARVELHWNGHVQAQEVTAATGFSAQNQRRLHYGLGDTRRSIASSFDGRREDGRRSKARRSTCGIT